MEKHEKQKGRTFIPNELLDLVIPRIPGAETKVLLYICRRTFGFNKAKEAISMTQFVNGIKKNKDKKILDYGTGLSRPSVADAIRALEVSGLIEVYRKGNTNKYTIKSDIDANKVVKKIIKEKENIKKYRKERSKQGKLIKSNGKLPTNKIMGMFKSYAKQIRGDKPEFTRNKDGKLIKNALKHLKEYEIEMLIIWFLEEKKDLDTTIGAVLSTEVINDFLEASKKEYGFYNQIDKLQKKHKIDKYSNKKELVKLVDKVEKLRDNFSKK